MARNTCCALILNMEINPTSPPSKKKDGMMSLRLIWGNLTNLQVHSTARPAHGAARGDSGDSLANWEGEGQKHQNVN